MEEELTVGEVADLVGVTIRTLHHWDSIALVRPSARSWNGYRLYSADDIARIHRVLVYRETGMPLARIAEVIDQDDHTTGLRRQRDLLVDRISDLQRMLRAVETILEGHEMGTHLSLAEQAEIFGTNWSDYHHEAEQAWGETPEWAQAAARQATMSKEDWIAVREESEALEADLAQAKRDGVTPGSAAANALAERHKAAIGRWFDTTHAKQVVIARGYTGDGYYRAHYDRLEPGLGAWLKAIVEANAAAHGVDPASAVWE